MISMVLALDVNECEQSEEQGGGSGANGRAQVPYPAGNY